MSERLTTADLLEIARKKGREHLLAISDRKLLIEAVTDILLERGSNDVFCKLAQNSGALFSEAGFEALIERARNDGALAERIGQRPDVPRHLLHELVLKATDTVRAKLLASAPPAVHAEVNRVLATISHEVIDEVAPESRDCKSAEEFVLELRRKNQLKEPTLVDFAKKREVEYLIAALALMTSTQADLVDRLLRSAHYGGLLVVCRAADLSWATVHIVLTNRFADHPIGVQDLELAKADYSNLTRATATRLLGFWKVQSELSPS
jgi:uncharacterized protein (DUF2336 family)